MKTTTKFSTKFLIGTFMTATLLAPLSHADHNRQAPFGYNDFAKVTHVQPVYKTVSYNVPEQQCRMQTRRHSDHSYTSPIIGGLIGGAIGNELGHKKRNKQVGAVIGAVLGASIGHDISRSKHQGHHQEQVCKTHYRTEYKEQLVGYDVKYSYKGRDYTTQMDHKPGKRLKVAVNVQPVY